MRAAYYGQQSLVSVLLDAGADVSAEDHVRALSVLGLACCFCSSCHAAAQTKRTALEMAYSRGHSGIATRLLKALADRAESAPKPAESTAEDSALEVRAWKPEPCDAGRSAWQIRQMRLGLAVHAQ